MKKFTVKFLSFALTFLLAFSAVSAELIASAASLGKVKSLQSYNIDDDEINLKWKKVSGATGYQVYVYSQNKWKKVGSTKKLYFEVDELSSAKQYKFKVRAYKKGSSKTVYGSYSAVLAAATKPDEVENVKAYSVYQKQLKLKWSAEKRVTGYQVYLYNAKTGKYEKKASVKNTGLTIKNLQPGTSYKFKVRAYLKANGKVYYGEFSDVVSVKTKSPVAAAASENKAVSAKSSSSSLISKSKAIDIALKHAGLKKSQVRELECELDRENGVQVYEVSFDYGKYDYDYEINAVSGKIIFSEKEKD